MQTTPALLKQHILATIDQLPENTFPEIMLFLERMHDRSKQSQQATYQPIVLGGLWDGICISNDDIADIRRDMWCGFGELDDV